MQYNEQTPSTSFMGSQEKLDCLKIIKTEFNLTKNGKYTYIIK